MSSDREPVEPATLSSDGETLRLADVLRPLFAFSALLEVDGKVLEVGGGALQASKTQLDTVLGVPLWTTPWWSFDVNVQQLVREAIAGAAGGQAVTFTTEALISTDGRPPAPTSVDLQFVPFGPEAARPSAILATATAVAARAEITGEPSPSGQRKRRSPCLQPIRNEATVGLAVLDTELRFLRVNQPFADLNGRGIDAHLGRLLWDVLPERRAQAEPLLHHVIDTGEPVLAVAVDGEAPQRPGVRRCWMEHFHPLPGADGTVEAVCMVREEVTARKLTDHNLRAYQREMEHRALHDALTGLPNRALLADRAQQAITAAERDGKPMALLLLDLDDFKQVNDTSGHAAGDTVLREVAARLRRSVRDVDTVGRFGGDEFAVVTGALETGAGAAVVAERILEAMTAPFDLLGRRHPIPLSIGIALYPGNARRLGSLFRSADLALYEAKRQGGNRATFFEPRMRDALRARQHLDRSLRRAAEDDEVRYELRVRHTIADRRLAAVELEPLWAHPSRGLTPLSDALAFAERKGLGTKLASRLVDRATEVLATLRHERCPLCLAFSPTQLADGVVVGALIDGLDETDAAGGALQVEVLTASAWPLETVPLHRSLRRLADRGIAIGLRGFGADHVTFRELRRLPLDSLILECDLVDQLGSSTEAATFVDALAGLGQRLGKRVVARGVRTVEQLDILKASGCAEAEGSVFGPDRVGEGFGRDRPSR